MPSFYSLAAIFTLAFSQVNAALSSGYVGPLTTRAQKAAIKICNVLDYGAVADGVTDIGVPITSAWAACIAGGVVKKGNKIAIQLDGTIVRTGTAGGNMIGISSTTDFEFFSGNSKGAIQGHGYEYISQGTYGARFIRFTKVNNFSIHGIALVDSPSYYYVFDTCTNGEIYNLILRGMKIGQTDGIDVFGENIWIQLVEFYLSSYPTRSYIDIFRIGGYPIMMGHINCP
jgi:rhamnogalacturonan hydrolase